MTDAIHWIESQTKFKPKTDLSRMRSAYQMLNLDFGKTKFVHVGGTNGKGSVCAYLTQICLEANLSVGTYTSPYLISFNERIRINGELISDEELLDEINEMYQFNETFSKSYQEHLAFFELLTLMALNKYSKLNLDVIVMEVGLGGLLDATNVINYDLSLITNIGFDHMKQLGNSLEMIASNKLGILKKGNHLITTVQHSLYLYFVDHMHDVGITFKLIDKTDYQMITSMPVSYLYRGDAYELSLLGNHQVSNSILAIEAISYLYPEIDTKTIQKALKKTLWAGRLEAVDKQVYIDGAHNIHALEALRDSLKDKKVHVLFSALGDKDIKQMIEVVKSFSKSVTLTSFDDVRFRDLSAYENGETKYIKDFDQAYQSIHKKLEKDEMLLITGSLHFVGFAKKIFSKT